MRTWFEAVGHDSPLFQGAEGGKFGGRNAEVHVVSVDDEGAEYRLRLAGTDKHNIAGPVAEALGRGLVAGFDGKTAGFDSTSPEYQLLRRCQKSGKEINAISGVTARPEGDGAEVIDLTEARSKKPGDGTEGFTVFTDKSGVVMTGPEIEEARSRS